MKSPQTPTSSDNPRFGQATESQIADVLGFAREIRKDMAEMRADWLGAANIQRINAAHPISWAVFYELPFLHHIFVVLSLLGLDAAMRDALAEKDPRSALLALGKKIDADAHFFDHLADLTDQERSVLLSCVIGTGFAMKSLETYSVPIHRLVVLAGQGDREAFRQAVTIDPTSVAAPSMLKRLSQAVMGNDREFLRKYRAALKGPHKALAPYADLRITHLILDEADALKESKEKIYELVVHRLQLYDHDKGDAMKGLLSRFKVWGAQSTR